MHAQLPLTLEDTTSSYTEARDRIRAEEERADRVRGLQLCIASYMDALRSNTYPVVGRGESLAPEHRPYFERQIVVWKADLELLTR